LATIALNIIATLFTYSRGAFVDIISMGATFWVRHHWPIRLCSRPTSLSLAYSNSPRLQLSIIGFAVGGTFVSLEMPDGYYLLLVIAAAARVVVAKERATIAVRREAVRGSEQNKRTQSSAPA
jgi:hypothetical protein